tara:strand:- start:638 stop:1045 length:408 start_codon:yes stop_codon:yes gene_type:complete
VTVQNVLARLDKVRTAGESKWRCPCPVHAGKDFNMMISERRDGSVGVHCFVCGATGTELMEVLGLPMKELFAEDSEYVRPIVNTKMREQKLEDEIVLDIAKSATETGTKLSLEDKRRIRLARHRIASIENLEQQQ